MTAARIHLIIGALFGAAGVALLAAGAHAVGGQASVAGQMLLFHASAIIAATAARKSGHLHPGIGRIAVSLIIFGVALFAADLVFRAFSGTRMFAFAAPLGGGMTIAGWLALTLSAIVRRSEM